jgi:hypothetical protein
MSTTMPTTEVSTPIRRRRRRSSVAGLCACLVGAVGLVGQGTAPVPATAAGGAGPDSYVTQWDAVGASALTAAGVSPAEGQIIYAYASIAVYDSVVAVRPAYRAFAVHARARRHTSVEAAVVAAAHRVYAHYLPDQAASISDPAYAASVATIADGRAKDAGLLLGERVARALIASRADDGFRLPVTYVPPSRPGPGDWLPTAPTPPIGTYVPHMRPFVLASADQLRPPGPPRLGSSRWTRDYREVQEVGSATSTSRSAEQTLAARFWGEPPVQQAHAGFRGFVREHRLGTVQAARLLAMLSVTYADAFIACLDAKYHFAFWRPVTAIRAGSTDGNPETVGDPAWTPLLPTPNHPDYPSAHSCVTPSAGLVLSHFLGSRRIDYTVPSLTGLGDRHFATVSDLTREVENARVWAGIHFRSAVEDGAVISARAARAVLGHSFQERCPGRGRRLPPTGDARPPGTALTPSAGR